MKSIYGSISLLLILLLICPADHICAQQADMGIPSSPIIESLEFREVDIKDVLRHLAKQYSLNIIFSEQVKGLVTVQLNNVTVDEALDSIITVNGFAYTKKERVIKVTTPEEAMREGTVTKVVVLNNADARTLRDTLRKVLSPNGSIEADIRSNSLIITDNPMVINNINAMIPQLDQATPQVLIEAKLIETSLSKGEKLGIDWTTTISASGAARPITYPFETWGSDEDIYPVPLYTSEYDPDTGVWTIESEFPFQGEGFFFPNKFHSWGGFPSATADEFSFGTLDFTKLKGIFDFLISRSDTRLIASPRIITLNNQKATINVGKVLSLPTYERNDESGDMEITGWEQQNVGVSLEVTPQVSPDGRIKLKLKPEVSSLIGYASERDNVKEGPITSTRTAETEVQIRDGQTVVIAGLIKNKSYQSVEKVPILGDIPGLGLLFTRKERSLEEDPDEKTDLIIFVTARIIRDTDEPLVGWEHNVMSAPPRPLKMNLKLDTLDPRFKVSDK